VQNGMATKSSLEFSGFCIFIMHCILMSNKLLKPLYIYNSSYILNSSVTFIFLPSVVKIFEIYIANIKYLLFKLFCYHLPFLKIQLNEYRTINIQGIKMP
jgi:hypothetical protein